MTDPTTLADNGLSKVYKDGLWVYKEQPAFLSTNEIWCLKKLHPFGFVPFAEQIEPTVIQMEYITPARPSVSLKEMLWLVDQVIFSLASVGIRHGDATEKNVICAGDMFYLIDFAESRLTCDPRPDKRPEGDMHWLAETIKGWYNNERPIREDHHPPSQ